MHLENCTAILYFFTILLLKVFYFLKIKWEWERSLEIKVLSVKHPVKMLQNQSSIPKDVAKAKIVVLFVLNFRQLHLIFKISLPL